jgi:hypothetical protein
MIRALALSLLFAAPSHTKADLDAASAAVKPLLAQKAEVGEVAATLDAKLGAPDKMLKKLGIASWYARSGTKCFELRFAFAGGPMVANVVETSASNCK